MKKLTGSESGFTLIELMIVVAIIGILVAVAIPNFMRAMDKAKYNRCLQALSGLKVAEEMYITDNNGGYTDQHELLGMYMIPGCTDPAGCGTQVSDRVVGTAAKPTNCKGFAITLVGGNAFEYQIAGTAFDRTSCKICVNAKGFGPAHYNATDCAVANPGNCP